MINIEKEKNLAPLTTFGVGGVARYFVEVFSEHTLSQAVDFAKQNRAPIFLLGGGSNILVSDAGFNGMVIQNKIKGSKIDARLGLVVSSAGEDWDRLVENCITQKLAGVECLSGIPGSVGGAVVQNIGAYGQTFGNVVARVRVFDTRTKKFKELDRSQCGFEYRNSLFKQNIGRFIIISVMFKLKPGGAPNTSYQDLKEIFGDRVPSLSEVRDSVLEIRAGKGMVINPKYESYKSAGSFFRNPVIDQNLFDRIRPELEQGSPSKPWFWPAEHNKIKISAAYLIGKAGFPKGYKEENVGISPKQNLAIINRGEATASEIYNFAQKIKRSVLERFGVELVEEVIFVGEFVDGGALSA
ncbi:MAG TPA: UDP-N-acetylmuramate dehydrogenase [Verrucomicrobiae bacterium]|nr:UDP-N-acetylmuramate dehydrogenase [Verrucomicrobiae bacterium]